MVSYPGNCTAKFLNQTAPEAEEVEIVKQSIKVHVMSYESTTDFVNHSFLLFDSSPLKALTPSRTVI